MKHKLTRRTTDMQSRALDRPRLLESIVEFRQRTRTKPGNTSNRIAQFSKKFPACSIGELDRVSTRTILSGYEPRHAPFFQDMGVATHYYFMLAASTHIVRSYFEVQYTRALLGSSTWNITQAHLVSQGHTCSIVTHLSTKRRPQYWIMGPNLEGHSSFRL